MPNDRDVREYALKIEAVRCDGSSTNVTTPVFVLAKHQALDQNELMGALHEQVPILVREIFDGQSTGAQTDQGTRGPVA